MKFCLKDLFSKFHQIRCFARIWSYLLKKPLIRKFIFCTGLLFKITENVKNQIACDKIQQNWRCRILSLIIISDHRDNLHAFIELYQKEKSNTKYHGQGVLTSNLVYSRPKLMIHDQAKYSKHLPICPCYNFAFIIYVFFS